MTTDQPSSNVEDDENSSVVKIDRERLASLHQVIDKAQSAIFYAELAKDKLLSEEDRDTESVMILLDEIIKQNTEVCRQVISFARFNLKAEDWLAVLRKKEEVTDGAKKEKSQP